MLKVFVDGCGLCFPVFAQHGPETTFRLGGVLVQDMIKAVLLRLLGRD